jgi:hypothetical protein
MTWLVSPNFDFTILIILGEFIMHCPSFLINTDIFLSPLFLKTCNLCSCIRVRDHDW